MSDSRPIRPSSHVGHARRNACCDEQAASQAAGAGCVVIMPREADWPPHLAIDAEEFEPLLLRAAPRMGPAEAAQITARLRELARARERS